MAEESHQKVESVPVTTPVVDEGVEAKDRGLFDFLGKKEEEKPQEEAIASEFGEKVKVSETEYKTEEHKEEEEEKEKKKGDLTEKLHRTGSSSSSSSSSDEEEREGEEKKKKKKEKKKKQDEEDTTVPVEKVDEPEKSEKGFLDKIKEKLPGHKKTEEVPPPPPSTEPASTFTTEAAHEGEAKEKKGFLDKIKEKLPGYHAKTEEEKPKERESASS